MVVALVLTGLFLRPPSHASAGFAVQYASIDSNGVESFSVTSANNAPGPQILRVLRPSNPAPGMAHNFILALPVTPGLDGTYGDGLDTLRSLGAQNQYNLTVIEPTFAVNPWYADNALVPGQQYETFLTTELQPWIRANLATTGSEQTWLLGFSKSGLGGMDLLLKHADIYSIGAFWDWPAEMSAYDWFGSSSSVGYGTDANFQSNYRLTSAFVDARKSAFLGTKRIWIGSYNLYGQDVADFDTLLTSKAMLHDTQPPTLLAHNWTSGWVPTALAALHADSLSLPGPTPTVTPTPSGKVGDLNNDGQVNIFDLSALLSAWGTANATADLNHDGTVNIFDLSSLLSHWGT
jgi:hypothetical protein